MVTKIQTKKELHEYGLKLNRDLKKLYLEMKANAINNALKSGLTLLFIDDKGNRIKSIRPAIPSEERNLELRVDSTKDVVNKEDLYAYLDETGIKMRDIINNIWEEVRYLADPENYNLARIKGYTPKHDV